MNKTRGARARIKLVPGGETPFLLVRFTRIYEKDRRRFESAVEEIVSEENVTFDGEVYAFHGRRIDDVAALVLRHFDAVYAPELYRSLPAAPNPWPIDEEPRRDLAHKPIVYMARVWHPEFAEALAFQPPAEDDDFLMELRLALAKVKRWYCYQPHLDVWVVADAYEALAHEVLDRFYACWWDEFFAGEEWNVLPPPKETQYPVRALTEREFAILGVPPFCSVVEVNEAYRKKKEAYNDRRIPVEEWMDVDQAFQRVRKYHSPREAEGLPETLVAPREVVSLLDRIFPGDTEQQIRWFHTFNGLIGGTPATMAETAEGTRELVARLQMMLALAPARKGGGAG